MKIISLLTIFILLPSIANAKHERDYQAEFCTPDVGIMEFELDDKTRVDCLTEEYAIEVDFAKKFYEGVSQSLYYAMKTGKKAKLWLIIEKDSDMKYYNRAIELVEFYDLPVEIEKIN